MRWGRWRFNLTNLSLCTKDKHRWQPYEIRLTECNTSAEILDEIAQLNDKTWTSSQDIGDLVKALDYLLGLQSNFCGSSQERSDGGQDYAKKVIERRLNEI